MSNENTMNPPEPTPIAIPPDFPVTWENPDDAHIFWQHDRMHFPDPAPPLERQFWALSMGKLNMEAVYDAPTNTRFLHVNTYLYLAWAPRFPLEEMEVQGKLYEEKLNAAIAQLGELWDTEWLPEIKTHLAFWDAFDLRKAGVPELLTHLDETFDRMIRLWEIHFLTVFPTYMAIGQFDELYQDLFGSEDAFASYKLLQGLDNKTIETDREQW
jgi:pyruvate,water dikinase